YGLTQKAIGLLEAVLRRAPRHTPTLEKLLDFVLGSGDDRRTAELAAQLEQIHRDHGDARASERFGELRRRFQRAAGISDEELFPQAAATEVAESASEPEAESVVEELSVPEIAAKEAAPAAAASSTQEVDLSEEWTSLLEHKNESEAPPAPHQASQPPPAPELPTLEEFLVSAQPAGDAANASADASEFAVPIELPGEDTPQVPQTSATAQPET